MRITDLLKTEGIKIGREPVNFVGAIDQMVDLMFDVGNVRDRVKLKDAVQMDYASAGKISSVILTATTDVVVAPGLVAMTASDDADYRSPIETRYNIIFLIATPKSEESDQQDILERLIELLRDNNFTDSLLRAQSATQFLAIIDRTERNVMSIEEKTSYDTGKSAEKKAIKFSPSLNKKTDYEPKKPVTATKVIKYAFVLHELPEEIEDNIFYLKLQNIDMEFLDDKAWEESLDRIDKFIFAVYRNVSGVPRHIGQIWLFEKDGDYTDVRDWLRKFTHLEALPSDYASLGVEKYYKQVRRLSFRRRILSALNDIPFHMDEYAITFAGTVIADEIQRHSGLDRLRRIGSGEAELTNYHFTFTYPDQDGSIVAPAKIEFLVDQKDKIPPSNVHALIGSNGSGKSHLLSMIAEAALNESDKENVLTFIDDAKDVKKSKVNYSTGFKNVLHISFSVFDPVHLKRLSDLSTRFPGKLKLINAYSHIRDGRDYIASDSMTDDFIDTIYKIVINEDKREYWAQIVKSLSENDNFSQLLMFEKIINIASDKETKEKLFNDFHEMSAGHKSVLLTIAKLIDQVEEDTLVLFDEPEEHLHPPLISGFIRSISDILVAKNGVGIIATHSSVILQEIPRKCVWIIKRSGPTTNVSHPVIETFGESLGTITNSIFGYEIEDTGFHHIIKQVAKKCNTYEEALDAFRGQLGEEGKSILLSLMTLKSGKGRKKDTDDPKSEKTVEEVIPAIESESFILPTGYKINLDIRNMSKITESLLFNISILIDEFVEKEARDTAYNLIEKIVNSQDHANRLELRAALLNEAKKNLTEFIDRVKFSDFLDKLIESLEN